MIIATAGHVDHGKTALVKALTGVDTDRLPEEKKRGLTIDLGFAYLPAGKGVTIGFIDVPGHERFVHNMLCGVAGIDAVLFIVAGDDGLMPQTREHLAILDLLEVRHGLVALTKTDRVPPERVVQVREEIAALAAGTTLAGMPVFPVSAHSGAGMAELKEYLHLLAHDLPPRRIDGNFRLSVDRSFTLSGAGLIVTGTVVSGRVEAGAQVRALLADVPARVRSIHAQNAASPEGHAGQRCALNLAGGELKAEAMHRGDWIVQGNAPPPVPKLDARLRVLAGERALHHWTPVHVHIGAADVTGRVAVLEGEAIAPGASGLVQLVLDRAVGAAHGDRLIIRDQSARRTIAGGRVIDVFTPPRGRAKPARLAYLRAMEIADHAVALAALLQSESLGLDLTAFSVNRNLNIDEMAALIDATALSKVAAGHRELGFLPAHWDQLRTTALAAVENLHQRLPDAPGVAPERLLEGSGIRLAREAVLALGEDLVQQGKLTRTGAHLRLPSHQANFNPADAALWAKIAPIIEREAARPPVSGEIAAQLKLPPKQVQALLERAARRGLVTRVGETRFFTPATVAQLAEIAQTVARQSEDQRITPLAFRDQSALGRNLAVEVLEYFDRVGYTRRVGDSRLLLKPAGEVFGS